MSDDEATLIAACAEARRIAPDLCETDPDTGESCAWYHGFWPYLHALNVTTRPDHHGAFYTETIGALARAGSRRVLISGSADFNMLQRVFTAFDDADTTPEVVFLDRCPTAVALAQWYAARVGRTVDARVSNILDFADGPFDIVCTHSFMGYFTDTQRRQLARKWASLLRPGGKVVTINRVRPGMTEELGFTAEQAKRFAETVRQAALARTPPLDIGADALAEAAALYAANFRIRPISALSVLEHFFADNGFDIERMDGRVVAGYEGKRAAGPTTPDGANYIHMIATRR